MAPMAWSGASGSMGSMDPNNPSAGGDGGNGTDGSDGGDGGLGGDAPPVQVRMTLKAGAEAAAAPGGWDRPAEATKREERLGRAARQGRKYYRDV
jgi:hypothetical protein